MMDLASQKRIAIAFLKTTSDSSEMKVKRDMGWAYRYARELFAPIMVAFG
jgi:hypothetical protein